MVRGRGSEKSFFAVFDSFGFYGSASQPTFVNNNVDPNPLQPEQINWFRAHVAASDACHKFVFTHGPAFSVTGGVFGVSVGSNMSTMWDIALNNKFDTYFCAHEHLYYRWNVGVQAYPTAASVLIQNLTGAMGAPVVPSSSVDANPGGRIYLGDNFVVVDVEGSIVTERAYIVFANGTGGFSTRLFDTSVIVK